MKALFILLAALFLSAPVMAEPCPDFDKAMADIEAVLDKHEKR